MKNIISMLTLVVFFSCNDQSAADIRKYKEVVEKFSLKEPVSYVISEFNTHNIIFLGGPHKVKEHIVFLEKFLCEWQYHCSHRNGS